MGKTAKNFKVVLFILGLSLVHTENGGLDAKRFPITVLRLPPLQENKKVLTRRA